MMSTDQMRSRFRDGAVQTASNEQVVVMAFDRLDRDLVEAADAVIAGRREDANRSLCHAQALLGELHGMVRLDVWEHAPSLAALYEYMTGRLVEANVHKDPLPVLEVQRLVSDLGDAFRGAARAAHLDPVGVV